MAIGGGGLDRAREIRRPAGRNNKVGQLGIGADREQRTRGEAHSNVPAHGTLAQLRSTTCGHCEASKDRGGLPCGGPEPRAYCGFTPPGYPGHSATTGWRVLDPYKSACKSRFLSCGRYHCSVLPDEPI